jgi:dTDP-4-dehydrorhamnose 3,5-epimerase
MQIQPLEVSGALLITPRAFADDRGYFKETYSRDRYREAGIADDFVQDNVSISRRTVLRGLHGDVRMSKLVQVLVGKAFDVVVDVRAGSPTRGRWAGVSLSGSSHAQIYIPAGCLHGFLAESDEVLLSYKQSAAYDPAHEFGVAWNDPQIGVAWPLNGVTPVLSAKDAALPTARALGLL